MGYRLAGFEPFGIDTSHLMLRYYPFGSALMDWRDGLDKYGAEADLIHASPPCQRYSQAVRDHGRHPDLIGLVREALAATGKPYVIENVPGSPLIDPLKLCGCMFGLGVGYRGTWFALYRPRLFELSWRVAQPRHRPHEHPVMPVLGQGVPGWFYRKHGYGVPTVVRNTIIGTPWMTDRGSSESIPPLFSQHLGAAFLLERGQICRAPALALAAGELAAR
jgi:DNA (cytosine-5)-methyltransferase 1